MTRRSRWWLLILLLLVSVLSFSSCRLAYFYPQRPVEDEKITLSFRHFWIGKHDEPMERVVNETIERFESEHPNIKVDVEGIDQTIHREQKLKSEMVTGQPPDIFSLFGGAEIEPYVEAGRLLDLTEFVQSRGLKSEFSDLDLWTFDDKIFGLPIEGNAEPLFYNKKIFSDLHLQPPQTIDDLFTVIKVLKSQGIIPFALGNDQRWPAAIYVHYLMDRQVGSDMFNQIAAGNMSFNNPDYLEAMTLFDRMVKEEAFPTGANLLSSEQAAELFTSGQAAMYLNGNWDISLFQDEDEAPGFQDLVGVLSFPAMTSGGPQALAGGYTMGIGISSALTGSKREAALEFLAELYKQDVQQRIMIEAYRIPVMADEVNAELTGPIFSQVINLTEASTLKFVPYDNMLAPEVKQTFLHVIAGIINQTITPEESLQQLDQAAKNYWELVRSR